MFGTFTRLFLLAALVGMSAISSFADESKSKDTKPTKAEPTIEAVQKSVKDYEASLSQSASPAAPASGEQIKWQVISAGGGVGNSTNYGLVSVLGQVAVGTGSSTNFGISHGFLQDFGEGSGGCCIGVTGNVDGDPGEFVDIGDLTALIGYLFIAPFTPPDCMDEANVDGVGSVDIGDLTALIGYLFIPPFIPPVPC